MVIYETTVYYINYWGSGEQITRMFKTRSEAEKYGREISVKLVEHNDEVQYNSGIEVDIREFDTKNPPELVKINGE